MTMPQKCQNGHHDLDIIMVKYVSGLNEHIVRWCCNCGAIVIDQEYDGRTNAGDIMKMRFPKCHTG